MDNDMMTFAEVEDVLAQIAAHESVIRGYEQKRDVIIKHYQDKITAAEQICENETAQSRAEIALLTEKLRRYTENNLVGNKRSILFPSGRLAFRKQPTRFFFGTQEVSAKDERLLKFVKAGAPEFVKTTEYVDWAALKNKLTVDGDNVYFADTGELIDGLRGQVQPDKFTVQIS